MKAHVYDRGWSGADIYFSESREKAVERFRAIEVAQYSKRNEEHIKHWDWDKSRLNPWKAPLEYALSDGFEKQVKTFDVVEGLVIETDGDN